MWTLLALCLAAAGPATNRSGEAVLRVGHDPRPPPWAFVPGVDYSKEDPSKPPAVTPQQLALVEGFEIAVPRRPEGRRAKGSELPEEPVPARKRLCSPS